MEHFIEKQSFMETFYCLLLSFMNQIINVIVDPFKICQLANYKHEINRPRNLQ